MNIPLLPANLFPNAYEIMQDVANSISTQYPNILKFLKYMFVTWLSKAEKVSVFDCPTRTNNSVESFHKTAAQKLRKPHSNIWVFLGNYNLYEVYFTYACAQTHKFNKYNIAMIQNNINNFIT